MPAPSAPTVPSAGTVTFTTQVFANITVDPDTGATTVEVEPCLDTDFVFAATFDADDPDSVSYDLQAGDGTPVPDAVFDALALIDASSATWSIAAPAAD